MEENSRKRVVVVVHRIKGEDGKVVCVLEVGKDYGGT